MNKNSEKRLWIPVNYDNNWKNTKTYSLDLLAGSWYDIKSKFQSNDYDNEFFKKHKRKHALETGVVERLYDIERGVTENLIEYGFKKELISHGSSNLSPDNIITLLKSNYEAIEYVFELVKEGRKLTKQSINELHTILALAQDTYTTQDLLGNKYQNKLIGGKYKTTPNNPSSPDGTLFIYCPPEYVESELSEMLNIYHKLEEDIKEDREHPSRVATWIHHAFTTIHPYPDGNGRVARFLATFIFIKHNLLPFTILDSDKLNYITALEKADNNEPQALVDFFCFNQTRTIKEAINYTFQTEESSLFEAGQKLRNIYNKAKERKNEERRNLIDTERKRLAQTMIKTLESKREILADVLETTLEWADFGDDKSHWYYGQIVTLAQRELYYFRKELPKTWYKLKFELDGLQMLNGIKKFAVIFTLHHFGNSDASVSIGALIDDGDREGQGMDSILKQLPLQLSLDSLANLRTEVVEQAVADFTEDALKEAMNILESRLGG
jgi:Fic family protein